MRATHGHSCDGEGTEFTVAPTDAVRKVLKIAGWALRKTLHEDERPITYDARCRHAGQGH